MVDKEKDKEKNLKARCGRGEKMTKKWNVRVYCMTASYNYNNEVAPDRQTAIENVRTKVMSDMKNWNFSASPAEDVDGSE